MGREWTDTQLAGKHPETWQEHYSAHSGSFGGTGREHASEPEASGVA
jgi:hypothetical protein